MGSGCHSSTHVPTGRHNLTLAMKWTQPQAALSMVSSCWSRTLVLGREKLPLRKLWRTSLSETFRISGCLWRSAVNWDREGEVVVPCASQPPVLPTDTDGTQRSSWGRGDSVPHAQGTSLVLARAGWAPRST